jgi:hypothetical protein
LAILQQMLEAANMTMENRSSEEPSARPRREAESVHWALTQVTLGHITLQIETDAIYFPMGELHEKLNVLGHVEIVISRMSMKKLQDLQEGLVQEIKNRGEEEHRELERIRDE